MFICPICKEQLNKNEKSYCCTNNHSFDIAKQGYVNLLPVNKKHSDNPGDSKDMVLSRRDFLESGNYDCFAEKLVEIINSIFADSQKISILDIGCGEGYYDGFLDKLKINYGLYGFDISKEAVRFASAKYKKGNFAVGLFIYLFILGYAQSGKPESWNVDLGSAWLDTRAIQITRDNS